MTRLSGSRVTRKKPYILSDFRANFVTEICGGYPKFLKIWFAPVGAKSFESLDLRTLATRGMTGYGEQVSNTDYFCCSDVR